MEGSDITGICLALAGLINICRRDWINRITGALLIVAGISQMHKIQELAVMLLFLLFIPIAAAAWILRATDKKRMETPSK